MTGRGGVRQFAVLGSTAPGGSERPGTGVVFVTPIDGAAVRAAQAAGFQKTDSLHTVQVQWPDKAGQGAAMMQALASGGLNLRGVSGAALGSNFVGYVALDTEQDATKAVQLLSAL